MDRQRKGERGGGARKREIGREKGKGREKRQETRERRTVFTSSCAKPKRTNRLEVRNGRIEAQGWGRMPKTVPASAAPRPNELRARARPPAKATERMMASCLSPPPPPMYPTVRGRIEREHGEREVRTPAMRERGVGRQMFRGG